MLKVTLFECLRAFFCVCTKCPKPWTLALKLTENEWYKAHLCKKELDFLVIFTFKIITLKVQEIEGWNFVCPNICKRCGWKQIFSHFGWEMTKISTVPKTMWFHKTMKLTVLTNNLCEYDVNHVVTISVPLCHSLLSSSCCLAMTLRQFKKQQYNYILKSITTKKLCWN